MKSKGLIAFFALAFGYTWGLGALFLFVPSARGILGPVNFGNPLVMSAVWSPSLAALLVSALQGRKAFSTLMARLFHWRIAWYWYIGPVALFAAMSLIAQLVSAKIFGTSLPSVALAQIPALAGGALLAFVLDPGPLGEELGWRGFALPRLQEHMNGLSAALLLGTIWAIWHLPAFFIPGMPQTRLPIWTFFISVIAASVIITFFVNKTGSVLPAILIHWSLNRFGGLGYPTALLTASVFVFVAVVFVSLTGTELGLRRESKRASPAVPENLHAAS